MARTSDEISLDIRSRLAVIDPDLSAEPVTVERKIIDTVADVVAESDVDAFVLDYAFDVSTKVGEDLDRFCAMFGFGRQGGRRATGTVTFGRDSVATADIYIPIGSQVTKPATTVSPSVVYATTASGTLFSGTTSVDIPVEAIESGVSGNAAGGTITLLGDSDASGISSVINSAPTTGGTEAETDDELRIRFLNMIFRNISGTVDQYKALAISSRFASKARVVGAMSRFSEFLQILIGTTKLSGAQTLPTSSTPGSVTVVSTTGLPSSGAVLVGNSLDTASLVVYGSKDATHLLTAYSDGSVHADQETVTFAAQSQIPNAKIIQTYDFYLTDGAPSSETFYSPTGDFVFKTAFLNGAYRSAVASRAAVCHTSGSQTLPLASILVDSTTGFAAAGTINIGNGTTLNTVTYTSKDATHFLGCTGGTGTIASGTVVYQGTLVDQQAALLEQTFTSSASRNDPANNVYNATDIFVAGSDVQEATESLAIPTSNLVVTAGSGTQFDQDRFYRKGTSTRPTIGNTVIPLLWQPVWSLPATITVGATTYVLGTDYWQLTDSTGYHDSRRSRDGIEWKAASLPAVGSEFVITYDFDRLPITLNELEDAYKQTTADVLVHSAKHRYFRVNLALIVTAGQSPDDVQTLVSDALTDFLEAQDFGVILQMSDILDTAANVTGVDAVRLADTTDDPVNYAVQEVDGSGNLIQTFVDGTGRPLDVPLNDDELPVLQLLDVTLRAQNTWRF
jgi:hypothetical protein